MKSCRLLVMLLAVLLVMPACTRSSEQSGKPITGTEKDLDLLDATRSLKASLEADPSDPRLIEALGNVYARRGLYAEAIDQYRTLVRLEPENAPAWHNLALCYERQGLYRESRSAADTAEELQPKDPFYRQEAQRIANLQRDLESGQRAFTSRLSTAYEVLRGDAPDAVTQASSLADELLERWPEQADAWNFAGLVAMKLKAFELASERFDTAIERDPTTLQARYNRALLAWDLQDRETAEAQLSAIVNLLPEDDKRARTYIQSLREDLAAGKAPMESRIAANGLE